MHTHLDGKLDHPKLPLTFGQLGTVQGANAKQLKAKLTPVVLRKIRHALGIFFIVFGIILATKRYIPDKTMDRIDNVIDKVRS